MKLFELGDYGDDVTDRFYFRADVHRDATMGAYLVGGSWCRYEDRLQIWLNPCPFVSIDFMASKLLVVKQSRERSRFSWFWERLLPDRRLSASAHLSPSAWEIGWTWYHDDICTQLNLHPLPFVLLCFERVLVKRGDRP